MMLRTIRAGSRYYRLNWRGEIYSENNPKGASGNWRLLGAVTRNNFGRVVRTWTFDEIWDNPRGIPWKFKNGKQRTFIQDWDHGTIREWGSPDHEVM